MLDPILLGGSGPTGATAPVAAPAPILYTPAVPAPPGLPSIATTNYGTTGPQGTVGAGSGIIGDLTAIVQGIGTASSTMGVSASGQPTLGAAPTPPQSILSSPIVVLGLLVGGIALAISALRKR